MEHKEATKKPVYRDDDNELLGYIKKTNDTWSAMTIFDYVFDQAATEPDARRIVENKGLEVLMGSWQYFDTTSDEWLDCVIIEASIDSVRIALMDGFYPDTTKTYSVAQPVAKHLRK